MCKEIKKIKSWALDNYATSYGASFLVECFSDAELEEKFERSEDAIAFAKWKDEQGVSAGGCQEALIDKQYKEWKEGRK